MGGGANHFFTLHSGGGEEFFVTTAGGGRRDFLQGKKISTLYVAKRSYLLDFLN